MSDATIARIADARADVEAPDELARLVSAVERMSEGFGGMLELALKLAPIVTQDYGLSLDVDEVAAVERLRRAFALAYDARVSSLTISRVDAAIFLRMVTRLERQR